MRVLPARPEEVGPAAVRRREYFEAHRGCLICGADPKVSETTTYLFCEPHLDQYHHARNTRGPDRWAVAHPDAHKHPTFDPPRCGRCKEKGALLDDYLCEECRYG